jgi:hypothetical protein
MGLRYYPLAKRASTNVKRASFARKVGNILCIYQYLFTFKARHPDQAICNCGSYR